MPPGFMKAIWAPSACVQASWASAITSPSGLSWLGRLSRTMSAVIAPTTRLAIGATAVRYLSATAFAAGSTSAGLRTKVPSGSVWQVPSALRTPFSAITLRAVIEANLPVLLSSE